MKSIILEDFGGADRLKLVESPIPQPERDEVQIKVAYAGVNPVDWKIREGNLKSFFPHASFPLIPGWDASGTISAVGSAIKDYKVGDEVFGYCRQSIIKWGTYAEYTCAKSHQIALKPANVSFAQAAAIPIPGLTAWQALVEQAKLKKGQTILIQGGAGGVGNFAIQLAKHIGAHVYTTARQKNHPYVQSLGADVAIDYTQGDLVAKIQEFEPQGFDIVLDLVGGQTLIDSFKMTKPGGYLVSIVDTPDPSMVQEAEIRTGYIFTRPDADQLQQIAEMLSQGKLKSIQMEEFPLEKAAEAQIKSQQGHVVGKIVLKIS